MGEKALRKAAKEGALLVQPWTLEEWLANECAAHELSTRASADALFLSWEWLTSWWQCYGAILGGRTVVLAFYRGEELVGLVPLYRRRVIRCGVLPVQSVQFVGLAWRDPAALISEYLDVVAQSEDLEAVRHACMHFLTSKADWTEFVAGFTAAGPAWRETLDEYAGSQSAYIREVDRATAYQADLSAGFGPYLRDLRQSTRRSLWNLRRRLTTHGSIALETVATEEIEAAFIDLNRLHQLRWQKPAFTGKRLEFHLSLARRLGARGELALSRMRVGGQVISVLYDVRKKTRQYNMKMGFDPWFSSQLSVGLIHLGYAMEAAAERGVFDYDFLAGPGRLSDYKRLLSQRRQTLSCVQMLRGPLLPAIYRRRDRFRPRQLS